MHILIIHQAFAGLDEPGGTRHIEIARWLVNAGNRVTIIASPVSYLTGKSGKSGGKIFQREIPQPGLEILRSYTFAAIHRSFLHRLLGFFSFMLSSLITGLQVKNIDLVWGTSPPLFQVISAWFLARIKRVPLLFEVRDLWPAFAIAIGVLKNPLLIAASEWLEQFLYHQADCVVVNSPGFIQHVSQRGAKYVELVPNGVDPTMFDPQQDGSNFRQQHNLINKFIVMYAGAHGISNDLETVLDAAEHLKNNPHICFVFVGDGKEKTHLQSLAQKINLDNLIFLPPTPKHQMSMVLAAADACIAILKPLDLYRTTYPNKVFDYMAAGRPVILAIDGVIRQVIESAGAGIFVTPGDALALASAAAELARNPQQAQEMGIAGRKFVEVNFNREQQAKKLISIIKGLGRPKQDDKQSVSCKER
ncbi:MAG: glycosyltransferase family 4 protein [Anaerolineaceae bacterium]|nr:glycosyltransferase family 4 protein [Anaerolineaceae bacterium]